MFDSQKFIDDILSKYVTYYDAEIGDLFCEIEERDQELTFFVQFYRMIQNNHFFDVLKVDQKELTELEFSFAKRAMISAVIKESKYDEHFMTWEKGTEYIEHFLNQFGDINSIYTNSYWSVLFDGEERHDDELDMTGWANFSNNAWYDYGFIVVSDEKIGYLWFEDES